MKSITYFLQISNHENQKNNNLQTLRAVKNAPTGFSVRKKSHVIGPAESSTDSSNSEMILATIEVVSALARDWPTQFCLPRENGWKASSCSRVGFSQRDGMKESGFGNTSGLRNSSKNGRKQFEPVGNK